MNTEKMQTLWRNIGAKNTKFTRTFDEFVQDMQDENNRRTLHSKMPSMFPEFNRTYEQMWGEDMDMLSTPEERMQQAMETAQAVKEEQEASPALNLRAPSVTRPEDIDGLYNKTDEELDAEIAEYMAAKEGRKKRAEEATYKAEKEQSKIGGLFNNQALNRQYVKESPSQDFVLDKDSEAKLDILQRERAWRQYNNQNSEYKQLGAELQRSMGELQRLRNKHGGNMDTGGMESYLQKAIQLYEAPSKYGNENGMANWWQGLAEKLSDKDTYLLDIPEMFRTANMVSIVKKMNAGEELTEREEALLNAFFLYGQVQDARQGDLSRGYTIGQGTAESIPFMAEMFLTAGAGAVAKKTIIKSIVKSGNKALAKRVARAFGDEIVEAGGKIALKEVEKGAAERVARGVADDVLMTAFMPTTWSSVNEDKLDKYLDGEDYTFKDFMRSFTNSVVETGTERWGGKIVDKTLGKVFSPIDKIWGKTSWGSMLTNDFIQSPFGETGEEYVGAIVNYLRSFNPLYDDESNAELRREASHLFSGAGFVDTMLTVLPMSLVGGGANVVARTAQKNSERYKKAYDDVANLFVEQGASPEQAEEILTQLESSEDTREFAKKMRDAYGILCSEYIAKDPSKDEYDAFVNQLDKVFGEYVKSARKLNISAGELQDMYNELSKEEKADVQAKVEEIAKPIAEAIPAEQQPQAAETPAAPAPEQPTITKKRGSAPEMRVTVDGHTYIVSGIDLAVNEEGTISGKRIFIKEEGVGQLSSKRAVEEALAAINQELAAKKQEAAEGEGGDTGDLGGDNPVRDLNAEIAIDQSLPLQEQLNQLNQKYQEASENGDAELMQALEPRIAEVSQQIEDSLSEEEKAARAKAAAEAEAAARAAEEEQRVQGIFDRISQALTEKGRKVLSGLTPEEKFIWRWRKPGGSIKDAIERAKAGIEEAKTIKDAEERDYEIEQWQALIDKYAPQNAEILNENKGNDDEDLHDDEKLGNFADGEGKPSVRVNISNNAGEGLIDKKKGGVVKNRIGELNERDRQQVLRGLYILRNSKATEAQKRKAEADIEEVQERRMRQMEAMVNAALEDAEGIKLYKIVKGIGVYNAENGEVIEYTYDVQLDVPEGKEELAAQLMAVVAQVCHQDSYIVNYAEGETNHGYPAKQVRVKLAKPLSLSDEAALSLSFTKTDIGATITDNEITAGFYPNEKEWEKLTDEEKQKAILDFEQSVINLLDKFHYGEDKSVHKANDIANATNETSAQVSAFDNDGRLAGSKIEIRDNYSDFNEGRKDGDERDYSEFYNRGTGGAENEADDVPVQTTSIAERIARVQQAYDEHEHDGTEYEEDIDEDDTKDVSKSKYAGNDLLADDVVYIRSSRGNNALAREKDGKYYELNSDKPKTNGNWKKEEKKVVFVGDKKYILATNADWNTLKSGSSGYSKNNGYGLRAWDVATGEEVYLDRSKVEREVEQEVGEGKKKTKQIVRVPVWENPENKQRFKDLKRSANTLDDILNYVVCEYNTPDGAHHEITLRDLLRGASTAGEKGRTSTVKTIDRFVNNILNELGYEDKTENVKANRNLGEEGTIQGIEDPSERVYNDIVGEMRSKIGDAIRVWNEMKGVAKDDNVTIKNGAELNQIVSNVIKLINKKQQDTGEDFLAEDRPARLKREQELKSLAEQIKTARERGNNELADELQARYEELEKSPLVEDNTDIEAEKRRAKNEEDAETDPTRLALLKTRNGIMLDLMYARKQGDEEQIEKLQQQVNDLNRRIREYDEAIELQAAEESQGSAIRRQAGERVANVLTKAGVKVNVINEADLPNYIGNKRYQELRTSDKVVYGFASGDDVYLVQERMNPDTPIHEYTHVWVKAIRDKAPKKWERIKGLLKRTQMWQEVLSDGGYKNIKDSEEAVASEVMSRLCGQHWGEIIDESGRTRFDEMLDNAKTVEEKSLLRSIRNAIVDFFRSVLELWNIKIGKTKSFNDLVERALQTPVQDLMKWSDAIQDMTSNESREQFNEMMSTYHGTTADFDKFDFTFMGTGEGMQAFGWGGYVSRVKDVAIGYANRGDSKAEIDGKTIESRRLSEYLGLDYYESNILNNILSYGITDIESYLRKEIKRMEDELNDIRNMTQEEYNEKYSGKGYHSYRDVIDNLPKTIDYYKNTLDAVEYSEVKIVRNPRLYTIEIPDDNGSNYLAWNERPTKEQFDRINDALEKIGHGRLKGYDSIEGEYTYKVLASVLGFHDAKRASAFLRQCGFVGIKVPIGYAHGREYEGEDRMNYVIFNEDDMKIVDKTTDFDIRAAEGETLSAEEQRIKSEAQERGDFMKAPNGNPTNLTEKQWLQTRTEAFKDWAGDWENGDAHIFLDDNGEPKVLYHGTRHFGFRQFDIDKSKSAPAIFFSDDVDVAKGYANLMAEISHLGKNKKEVSASDVLDVLFSDNVPLNKSLNLIAVLSDCDYRWEEDTILITSRTTGDAFGIDTANTSKEEARKLIEQYIDTEKLRQEVMSGREDGGIYAVYVRNNNVLEIDGEGKAWDEIPVANIPGYPETGEEYTDTNWIAAWAKDQGYDGVVLRNTWDSAGDDEGVFSDKPFDEYISLRDKGDIKSATDNRGTFDENNPDIEFSIGSPDPSDISAKTREVMEKKKEKALEADPMATKPAQRLDNLARLIYENQDNTIGLKILQDKLNLWKKEKGEAPIPDSQDVRSKLVRLSSAIASRITWFEQHEQKNLQKVFDRLSEKIGKSALAEDFKQDRLEETDENGNTFYHQTTAKELLERYIIARDNIERAEMKEAGSDIAPRGEKEFAQRMGISMAEYADRVHSVLSEKELNELWDAIRSCTRLSLKAAYEGGLIDEDYYNDKLERQFYVPEKGFAEENTNEDLAEQRDAGRNNRRGGKKSVKAEAFAHKAEGGDSMATDVLAHIIFDVKDAIAKGETNKVRQAMFNLLNDSKDYCEHYKDAGAPRVTKEWFVKIGESEDGTPIYERSWEEPSEDDKEEAKIIEDAMKGLRKTINSIREEMKSHKKSSPEWVDAKSRLDEALEYMKELKNDLPFLTSNKAASITELKDKRKDVPKVEVYIGGERYVMTFNGMKEVADALNGEYNVEGMLDPIKKMNAIVASLFTTYNPTFFAVNIARDVPYIMLKGGSEYGPMFMARFMKNMTLDGGADMRKAIWQQLAGRLDTSTEIGKQLYNFMMGGGNTGYSQMQDIKAIRKMLNDSRWQGIKQLGEISARLNEYSELLTRFTAYRTALEMGYSENEALNAAKNLSTNFNMRGAGNKFINFFNSISMFSNAAIQGAAGFYKTFNTPEKAKRAFFLMVLSPAFLGFLNTLINPDDDDEEKEVADYYRDNYFCCGPVKIPITQELRPFWRIGVNFALQMQGRRTAGETAQSVISGFTEYAMPVPPAISQTATGLVNGIAERGVAGGVGQGVVSGAAAVLIPQYAEGAKELISNKDFMGNPIVKNYDWSDTPLYTYNKSEAELYKDLAYGFYLLGGGNPDHPSKFKKNGEEVGINLSPKEIKKGMGIVGSTGVLQFLCTFYGLGKAAISPDVEVKDVIRGRDILLYGTFVRPEEQSMYRYKIYKEMNDKVKAYELQLKGWNDHIKRVSSEEKKAELERQRDEWLALEQEKGFDIKEAKKAIDAYKKSNAYNVSVKLGRKEEDIKAEHPEWEEQQKRSVQAMNEMLMVYKGLKEQVDYIQPPKREPQRRQPVQRQAVRREPVKREPVRRN